MKTIAEFAENNNFKVLPGTSLTTMSKDGVKFRITRQAAEKYKLTISKGGRIPHASSYHYSEEEIIDEIATFLEN